MERGGWEGEEIYRPRVFRNSTSDELTHCMSGQIISNGGRSCRNVCTGRGAGWRKTLQTLRHHLSFQVDGWGESSGLDLSRGLQLGQGARFIPRGHLCPAHSIVPMALMGKAMVMYASEGGDKRQDDPRGSLRNS